MGLTPEGLDSTATPSSDDDLELDADEATSIDDIELDLPYDDARPDGGDGGEQLPDELMADAMGRPLSGSDDDQGMEHAAENLGGDS
jgi:hypothetical protein